jgi:ubiquinone/menaquinone biosynthesis C-methylase UbiE
VKTVSCVTSARRAASDYALTFGSVAEQYERARPPYADEAVAWLAERLPAGRVLDLAAGTGKLTRQLVALGGEVVAVEPDPAMRATLARVVPGVEPLAGTAEDIPLADGSVDAVFVGQAFHWFRRDEALAEMHRVIRPGGGFALLWNTWDERDPLLHAIDELLTAMRPERARRDRARIETPLFGPVEERTFRQARTLTGAELADWAASTSPVFNAPEAERTGLLARVRELAGDGPVEVAICTDVAVADRVS